MAEALAVENINDFFMSVKIIFVSLYLKPVWSDFFGSYPLLYYVQDSAVYRTMHIFYYRVTMTSVLIMINSNVANFVVVFPSKIILKTPRQPSLAPEMMSPFVKISQIFSCCSSPLFYKFWFFPSTLRFFPCYHKVCAFLGLIYSD